MPGCPSLVSVLSQGSRGQDRLRLKSWRATCGLGWVRAAWLPVLAGLGASVSPSPGHNH